ncbi:MAG: desulfoferrodoxin [Chloroflexi bacterium]|nr:desulfoferrodoxin [Chloroflexota bacterium]
MANTAGKRYQCKKCGAEVMCTRGGQGAIKCCGEPMQQK